MPARQIKAYMELFERQLWEGHDFQYLARTERAQATEGCRKRQKIITASSRRGVLWAVVYEFVEDFRRVRNRHGFARTINFDVSPLV
jgi:hypothetical protein